MGALLDGGILIIDRTKVDEVFEQITDTLDFEYGVDLEAVERAHEMARGLVVRRDALLELVSDLSRNTVSADEAAELHSQTRALIAEVGALRSRLRSRDCCINCGAPYSLRCSECF